MSRDGGDDGVYNVDVVQAKRVWSPLVGGLPRRAAVYMPAFSSQRAVALFLPLPGGRRHVEIVSSFFAPATRTTTAATTVW